MEIQTSLFTFHFMEQREYDLQLRRSTQILDDMRARQLKEWNRRQKDIEYFERKHAEVLGRLYSQIPKSELQEEPCKSTRTVGSQTSPQSEIRIIPSEPEIRAMVRALDVSETGQKEDSDIQECLQHFYRFGER